MNAAVPRAEQDAHCIWAVQQRAIVSVGLPQQKLQHLQVRLSVEQHASGRTQGTRGGRVYSSNATRLGRPLRGNRVFAMVSWDVAYCAKLQQDGLAPCVSSLSRQSLMSSECQDQRNGTASTSALPQHSSRCQGTRRHLDGTCLVFPMPHTRSTVGARPTRRLKGNRSVNLPPNRSDALPSFSP